MRKDWMQTTARSPAAIPHRQVPLPVNENALKSDRGAQARRISVLARGRRKRAGLGKAPLISESACIDAPSVSVVARQPGGLRPPLATIISQFGGNRRVFSAR